MTVTITESGLDFGPYKKSDVFHIEKSDLLKAVGKGVKTVEFILWQNNNNVVFVEAKSSAPRPGNQKDLDSFIEEMSLKFTHSLEVFFSAVLKRCADPSNEFPKHFNAAACSKSGIELILVITGHKEEWLHPVSDNLNKVLSSQRKIWKLRPIRVLNEDMARQYHLIQ